MLDGGPWDDDSEREFLEIVRQSADKLSILVENLLDAAKAEAKTWSLDPEPVRVERIAQQVVTQRSLLSPDHALECVVEPDLPLVNADPMRVEQIITNLIDNAIKYSPEEARSMYGSRTVTRLSSALATRVSHYFGRRRAPL